MYSSNATIEPRLIALLNEQPSTSRIDLPPLQDPNVLKASGRPHVLEPTTHTSNHKEDHNAVKSSSQKISQILSAEPANTPRDNSNAISSKENVDADRALGLSSPQSLRKILQVEDESPSQRSSKRRHRIEEVVLEAHKDEFVQLPQPPAKKQKAPKQVVPPIIIGLFEPPPNAALFPPIASSAFHDSHGRNTLNVNVPTEKGKDKDNGKGVSDEIRNEAVPKAQLDSPTSNGQIDGQTAGSLAIEKAQKKPSKSNRKKWTEEETNQLLLGVHKYGIGKWKAILNDPSFKFNNRIAPDLKDRFRTCCPAEIREQVKSTEISSPLSVVSKATAKSTDGTSPKKSKSTSSLMSENILIEEFLPARQSAATSNNQSRTASPDSIETKRAPRAHRRQLSDLASLGISGPLPFKKSSRKERRPFTEEEDNSIMKGYISYGPQWAKIQADKDLGLKERRSTDIRDRFRNRWKSIYENMAFGENASAAKAGSIAKSSGVNEAMATATSSGSSLPSLPSKERIGSSEKPKIQRGTSFDLMTLSSNSISNPYPLSAISSQTKALPGKEIFYQLPNPSSTAPSSSLHQLSSTNTSSEALFTSSNEQSAFSYNQPTDWNDNILAPFNANGLGEANEVSMETNDNVIGVEEIVASFNPSSVGEMDISRFLLDDTWPLKE